TLLLRVVDCVPRQDYVLVEPSANIDRRRLDDIVYNDRERREEAGGVDLGVEEDLRSQELLVAHINRDLAPARLYDGVLGELGRVAVKARKLLDYVGADIAVLLLDLLGCLQRRIWL